MTNPGRVNTLHPIIMLDYVPRATGQVFVCILCIVTLIGQGRNTLLADTLAAMQGLVWPNLALFIAIKSKDPKSTEFKLLFIDSLLVGMWITYLHFSLWPTVTFACCTFMASLSVQGLRLGIQSIFANILGAVIVIPLFGLNFQPDADLRTVGLSAFGIMTFTGVMGYMTFYRARINKITKEKLKQAYQEMDKINRVLKEGSSSLELENILGIIFDVLRDIFSFDFITIQIAKIQDSTLKFRAVHGEAISAPARKELEKIHVDFTTNCVSVQAFNEKQIQHFSEIGRSGKLSTLDQKIQNILWFSSIISAPILIKNKVIGVLSFYGRHEMELNQQKLDSINFYITQVAIIINNAILYDELKNKQAEIYSKNKQLSDLSDQLGKYLSPQIVKRIMEGEEASVVGVNRKKLTIFFSDIVGFTNLSDHIASEELTTILNNYLDEMTSIALKYGGTVDKYIGDAIMVFFGDPETKGIKADAINCAKMAIKMKQKINDLKDDWENIGIAKDLHVRMGINSGYCAVGNFGSEYRMDYTVIGSTVNLASRLQSAAQPDEILVSHETYILIKDEIECVEGETVSVKGITQPVKTYLVKSILVN